GAITETSTDAVNGSQLHAVATEAGKHTTLSNGKNTTVNPVTTADGHLEYKVDVNDELKDIKSIIGAGEGAGSISFADGGIKLNNKVTINKDGKITGVAAGVEKTDAVNVGQLTDYVAANDTHIKSGNYAVGEVTDSTGNKSQGVSMDIVNKEGKVTGTVTITDVAKASDVGEVNNIDSDIKNQNGSHTTVVDAVNNLNQKLNNKVGDLNYVEGGKGNYVTNGENTTTSIGKLDQALKDVAATAAKHTTVTQGDNITVTPGTNTDGSKNYNVALKKDITVESVTANTFKADQTVMNKDGLKVGNKVSVSATAVTAGKTSISDEGVKVGGKTYISDKGLNANDQKVTNVAAGELSATSKDAVNGSQLYETNQAIANNATNISSLSHSISNLDNRVNKVGAGAAALAALHPLDFDPDAKWDFAAGYGNYRGANAAAVGAYYRPNEDTMFSVGGTFGNGENMVNAGVSFKLGSGSSHVSTSRVAMAKEIKELRGELEAMKSAMLDANAGKKIDTSKLQLFPDVPQNHWAYEYVAQLAGNGMIEGYPDGNFAGDRPMTRYEFAAILYRAMTKGAVLSDKILSEFSHELEYFTVDTIAKDKAGNPTIQRVRIVKENKNK
ncbi:S-layer homology domain-containing protein, partial [Mitsuokella jalaludinii]